MKTSRPARRCRPTLAILWLLPLLLTGCGGGGNGSASTADTATTPAAATAPPPVVADAAREARPGLNGVRAALAFSAEWDAGLCTTLTVFNRHPSATLTAWQATVDLGAWTLQSTSGGRATASTGIVVLKSEALGSPIAAGGSGQARLCMQALPAAGSAPRRPVLVRIDSDLPPPGSDAFEAGLWRIAAPLTRLTLGWSATGRLLTSGYSGHPDQQWRLRARGGGSYQWVLESRGQCLAPAGSGVTLADCADAGASVIWTLETLRARSDDRPALYRMHRGEQGCLRAGGASITLGACDADANLYMEPVGYGERAGPVEFELRGLLLVKPSTDVAAPRLVGAIPSTTIAAVQVAYRDHLAVWFDRISDGRIRWVGESALASPMTAVSLEGGNWLPAASTMPQDVQQFLPPGRYDTATVFFTAGVDEHGLTAPGGWGWGPGISPASNYTMWVTVNGGMTPAADWVSWQNEPMEVFVHEPMHGLDGYFDKLGVPLPTGYLHGSEANEYVRDQHGWMPWYRDVLLGTVIGADGSYRGYGPRAFRYGPPRQAVPAR